ncbi:MAG: hypothetical protein KGI03_00780 [Patescibacteria group bacterium]|nr:hypothetical protein [Patescibacteria group bacterium]
MKNARIVDQYQKYFLTEIAREGWLGTRSPFVVRRILTEHKDILKPQFIGKGRSTRILVSGADIQRFQRREAVLANRKTP